MIQATSPQTHHLIAEGTHYFPGGVELPGIGVLPVNFFAITGKKTMVIDTGAPTQTAQTIEALSRVIDPASIDYIFLTHMDIDHYGGVSDLLKLAPKARLVGNIANMNKGTTFYGMPPERFAVVWPGQEIDLGDRVLVVEPALIQDGDSLWLFDTKTRTYFTSDGFGAIHFAPPTDFAEDVPDEAYAGGFTLWQSINFTHFSMIHELRFAEAVKALKDRDIQQIASVHGPVVRKDLERAFDLMAPMPTVPLPSAPPLPPIFSL